MEDLKENQLQNNPYPGIRSFEINESHLFFGRDEQIKKLHRILNENHFIAITGASGSGKSSIVKAGLLPKLKQNCKNWAYQVFHPGNDPIGNFSKVIFDTFKLKGINKEFDSWSDIEHV